IFRIVQEGLANVRKHANARRAEVTIGQRPFGERFVTIRDDGAGFDGEEVAAGQGLRNMRARAKSIEGGFSLVSRPGAGTALAVVFAYTFRSFARAAPTQPIKAATWADVKPILAEHCVSCHTVGGVAPFPLTTAKDAHAYAQSILAATQLGVMPPWPPGRDS